MWFEKFSTSGLGVGLILVLFLQTRFGVRDRSVAPLRCFPLSVLLWDLSPRQLTSLFSLGTDSNDCNTHAFSKLLRILSVHFAYHNVQCTVKCSEASPADPAWQACSSGRVVAMPSQNLFRSKLQVLCCGLVLSTTYQPDGTSAAMVAVRCPLSRQSAMVRSIFVSPCIDGCD